MRVSNPHYELNKHVESTLFKSSTNDKPFLFKITLLVALLLLYRGPPSVAQHIDSTAPRQTKLKGQVLGIYAMCQVPRCVRRSNSIVLPGYRSSGDSHIVPSYFVQGIRPAGVLTCSTGSGTGSSQVFNQELILPAGPGLLHEDILSRPEVAVL